MVTILTVCHNQLQHTRRFVSSLRRFTAPGQWELLAVDSGSADGTRQWLRENNIRHLAFEENIGWVRGINEALKALDKTSEIVIFCNNDIVFDRPGWLDRLLAHFDNPAVGAVGPTSNYVIGRQNTACNVPHVTEEETHTLIGFCLAVRREVTEEIGGLDESLSPGGLGGGDDHDYSIRMRRAGWKLVIARDVFVWHAGSRTFFDKLGEAGYNDHWRACDKALERKWGEVEVRRLFEHPQPVTIGIALRGWHCHWKFARSLALMQKPVAWNVVDAPRAVIDQARNLIVEQARKTGATHILFVDDDHILPHDLFYKLMSHGKPVCGALGFRRVPPYGPCLFDWMTHKENGNLMVMDRPDLIRQGLQRVDAIGFGAVLIRLSVFDKIPHPWFRFGEVGEDLTFCDLCAQAGIEVWCDTDLVIPHITDEGIEITEQVFYEYHRQNASQVKVAK